MKSNVHIRQPLPNWLALLMTLLYGAMEQSEKEKMEKERVLKKARRKR